MDSISLVDLEAAEPDIPVLYISGLIDSVSVQSILLKNPLAILMKPFTGHALSRAGAGAHWFSLVQIYQSISGWGIAFTRRDRGRGKETLGGFDAMRAIGVHHQHSVGRGKARTLTFLHALDDQPRNVGERIAVWVGECHPVPLDERGWRMYWSEKPL